MIKSKTNFNTGKKRHVETPCDQTSARMKKAKIPPLEAAPLLRKGAWQIAKENGTDGKAFRAKGPGKRAVTLDNDTLYEMAKEKAGGATIASLSARYGVSEQYVMDALKKVGVSCKKGKEVLRGLLLENAISTGMHGRAKINELNGMQAVVASGIMTQRFIDLDKHMQSTPETVDVAEIEKVGRLITQLERGLGDVGMLADDKTMGEIIDVSAQVSRE